MIAGAQAFASNAEAACCRGRSPARESPNWQPLRGIGCLVQYASPEREGHCAGPDSWGWPFPGERRWTPATTPKPHTCLRLATSSPVAGSKFGGRRSRFGTSDLSRSRRRQRSGHCSWRSYASCGSWVQACRSVERYLRRLTVVRALTTSLGTMARIAASQSEVRPR